MAWLESGRGEQSIRHGCMHGCDYTRHGGEGGLVKLHNGGDGINLFDIGCCLLVFDISGVFSCCERCEDNGTVHSA